MTNNRTIRQSGNAKAHRTPSAAPPVKEETELRSIAVERSGDWMPAEELRESVLAALSQGNDVTLNLDKIYHLDASALQILLALDAELTKRGKNLLLAKVSPHLLKWFEFAGADQHFFHDRTEVQ
jgi:anti-anti-sigma factor